MKYVAVLALGILTGLAFSHLPPYPIFRDEPETPPDHKIKQYWYLGGKRVSQEEYKSRYFNGGVASTDVERFKAKQRASIKGVQAWDANGVEIADAQAKWERGEL